MAAAPSSSSLRPATSMPTRATTPARPTISPTSREPVARSARSKRSASSATKSGTAAMMIAASDEATWRSPAAMSGNGRRDLDHRVDDEPARAAEQRREHARPPRQREQDGGAEGDAHEGQEDGRHAVVDG